MAQLSPGSAGVPRNAGGPRGSLIDGWAEGTVVQPVGSKRLLSVLPEKGYGQRSMGPILGRTGTLSVVADALGFVDAFEAHAHEILDSGI